MQGRERPHRDADDMRLLDFELVEQAADIVARPLLRVSLEVLGYI